jgi:Ca2+-binding RTX toxin-like protein
LESLKAIAAERINGGEWRFEMNGEKRQIGGRGGLALLSVIAGLAIAGTVPSAAAALTTVGLEGSRLSAYGDIGYDQITVSDQNDPACPAGPPCYRIDAYGGGPVAVSPPCVMVPSPNERILCPASGVESIRMVGREANDLLQVSEFAFGLAVPVVLDGGAGLDTLTGSGEADRLIGGDDGDDLNGRDGNDLLLAGAGKDRLDGARGNDRLVGDYGPDHLIGGTGADQLFGRAGRDLLDGQQAMDLCNGGTQLDRARNCERLLRIP